jgi:hypothetical protein
VKTIGIGIGSVNIATIQKLSSPGCAFVCPQYSDLNNCFGKIKPKASPPPPISIKFVPLDTFTSLKDPLKLRIQVKNFSKEDLHDVTLVFEQAFFYDYARADVGTVKAGKTQECLMEFDVLANAKETTFPERLLYVATAQGGQSWKGSVDLATGIYELVDCKSSPFFSSMDRWGFYI